MIVHHLDLPEEIPNHILNRPLFAAMSYPQDFQSRNIRRWILWFLFLFVGIPFSTGCNLNKKIALPEVIGAQPTREEIASAINQNTSKIESLASSDGTLGVSSSPWTAKCILAYQRSHKVRLRGNLNMVGPILDLGADDQNFWFWYKYQEPNQISYCALSDYAKSSLNDQIPVDPVWFPNALGVVEIDPNQIMEGPIIERDQIKLIVKKTLSEGDYYQTIYLEPKTAAIQSQEIKHPVTQEVLTIVCDEFQFNEEKKVVLPRKIRISRSSAKETVHLNFGTLTVNPPNDLLANSFQMPRPEELGTKLVNIASGETQPAETTNAVVQKDSPVTPQTSIDDIPAYGTQPANSPVQTNPVSSENGWGTGNSVYANNHAGYSSEYSGVREIPSSSSDAREISSSFIPTESSATAQIQTTIIPDETRFTNERQGFFKPSL